MLSQKALANLVIAWVAVPSLAIWLGAGPAMAQNSNGDYIFLIASGFLCDSSDSSACPAVVKSADGSSYEMSGAGTLSTQSKSVTAAGTFTRESSNGNTVEKGIWIASELVSFDSYGIAPDALMRTGSAFGPPAFGPMRSRMFPGSVPAGGLAVFRIRLLPVWGVSKTATLEVNCALGKVPDEHPTDGTTLTFEGGGEFDQEIRGRTMFFLTRPGTTSAAKPSTTEGGTNSVPTQLQP